VFNEAVANAFDAKADRISIHIVAEPLSITITDNGEGFTDERFERFSRLMEPKDTQHQGLGRLVYLHYFSRVSVHSSFAGKKRSFEFSNEFDGGCKIAEASDADTRKTTIRFDGFIKRLRQKDDIKPEIVKARLFEHFLPTLHDMKNDGKDFTITIELEDGEKTRQMNMASNGANITPADIPQLTCEKFLDKSIDAFNEISMNYAIQRTGGKGLQLTAICVDGRTIPVPLVKQNAIPIGCTVVFLFESKSFAGKCDSARQRLVFPESIPQETVFRVLRQKMAMVLSAELPEIKEKNTKIQQRFEALYPHLMGLFDKDAVGIIDAEEALKNAQYRFFQVQRSVLESETLDEATYEKTLELSSRVLAEYILYRDFTIKKLASLPHSELEGQFHDIIAPRKTKYDGTRMADHAFNNNVWLLDDKFMTYRATLSNLTMSEVISEITKGEVLVNDGKMPDIAMVFSANPDDVDAVDVVIVELKGRRKDEKENHYAQLQLVQRARKLVNYMNKIQRMWYYSLFEIDDDFADALKVLKWTPLYSNGKVFYQEFMIPRKDGPDVPMPTYVLSYETFLADAKARNYTFLEMLKDQFKKAAERQREDGVGSDGHELLG
ncbi:MAG TPA: ATP-binding protein, partial [Polyangium sp.]|nr:ATP-binding protein [Polyangium sp.]